jgi:predicted nucleic acid-binding protein
MSKPIEVALDTCVILDLADDDEAVIGALKTISKKIPDSQIVILPTVIQELAAITKEGDTATERALAVKALKNIRGPWNFVPVICFPVGCGIVEETARKIRGKGLIPDEEVHDSFIVAEAGLRGVSILLSSDAHIKDIDYNDLKFLMDSCDLSCPLLVSPRKVVALFSE